MSSLETKLYKLELANLSPKLNAYHRIDGPGSSLDLREFQQAFWRNPNQLSRKSYCSVEQNKSLPRTIGITINTGTSVTAHPIETGWIGIKSHEYGFEKKLPVGSVPFKKEYWLLKIMDSFGLNGAELHLHNLMPGTKSSGLGGSATATTAVCMMANKLVGDPLNKDQLIAMASMLEQDMGISITGTQEQANVIYGGITDYVWFPWGIPGLPGAYGSSLRFELLGQEYYDEFQSHLRIYHSGEERLSSNVNEKWRERLNDEEGFKLHASQLKTAYDYRTGIKNRDWDSVAISIRKYRMVREQLSSEYMTNACKEIQIDSEKFSAESFPLGAGGGGALMIFGRDASQLELLDEILKGRFTKIPFKLRNSGHEFFNCEDLNEGD